MTQPRQNLGHRGHNATRRQRRPVDHDNAQAQRTGGEYLGLGPRATCIFGDDMGDLVGLQKGGIASTVKRAARDDDASLWQGQRTRRVNQPQQVVVLGFGGKAVEVLLANREKNPRRRIWQSGHCRCHVGHMDPIIPRFGPPRGALQDQQLHPARKAGVNGVPAHLGGKGMGGIDNMCDAIGPHIVTQAHHTAKAAHARGQGLQHGMRRAPSIGKDCGHTLCGKGRGKLAGFGGSAQQEGAHG